MWEIDYDDPPQWRPSVLTSKPKKKKRGRQPPVYGPRVCPWCATKLKQRLTTITDNSSLFCPNDKCGWKE